MAWKYFNTTTATVKAQNRAFLSTAVIVALGLAAVPVNAKRGSFTDALERAAKNETAVTQGSQQLQQLQEQPASPERDRQIAAVTREREHRKQETLADAAEFSDSYEMQKRASDVARQAEDWEATQRVAAQAVRLAGDDPDKAAPALNNLAFAAMKSEDYETAAAASKRALELKPRDPALMKALAGIYYSTKDRSKAGAIPAIARTAPGAAPAPSGPAGFASDSGARPSPYLAPVPPNIRGFLDNASNFLKMRDYRAALAEAQRASSADPGNGDAYMQQAIAWTALKNMSEAMLAVGRAIEAFAKKDQKDAQSMALALRAGYKNQGGDHPGAKDDANSAIVLNPTLGGAYFQRGVAKRGLGEDYLADYRLAAEHDPSRFRDVYLGAVAGAGQAAAAQPAAAPSAEGGADWLKLAVTSAGIMLLLLAGVAFILRKKSPVSPITWSDPQSSEDSVPLNGKYIRGKKVGSGGMGDVYEGTDVTLNRPVAIKRLRPELQCLKKERARFVGEAHRVAKLHHPNIVEIYDIVETAGDTYIIFEYVDGRTLHDELNNSAGRRLPQRVALEHLRDVAEALDHAHKRGVIHRDIKPSNIMVDEEERVKVMDFGISRVVQDTIIATQTETIVGTPGYMAPEQSMGAVNKTMDVYALGVSFYEMLAGIRPFKDDDLSARMEGRFPKLSAVQPGLPPALDGVIAKALAPDPNKRYQSCLEFYRAALDALGQATPT